ncbi:MAG: S-adenosylmethionine:tRNA ribosyltransferase-isomerase, partial [Bacteroidales bacterium]
MKLSQFNYPLSINNIAKYPAEHRDESRMMVLHKDTGEIEHKIFKDIINYAEEGDLFV